MPARHPGLCYVVAPSALGRKGEPFRDRHRQIPRARHRLPQARLGAVAARDRRGVTYGPDAFVRYSPPVFGLRFGAPPRHRRAVRRNLRRALGKRSARARVLDVARVFATTRAASPRRSSPAATAATSSSAACVHDEHYVAAAEPRRGVILATAHTGGWQARRARCSTGARRRPPRGDAARARRRRRRCRTARATARASASRTSATNPLDALPLLAHLRGGVVAVQMDRLPQGMRGRKAELFGEPWIARGPAAPRGRQRRTDRARFHAAASVTWNTKSSGAAHPSAAQDPPSAISMRPRAVWRRDGALRAREPDAVVPLRVKRCETSQMRGPPRAFNGKESLRWPASSSDSPPSRATSRSTKSASTWSSCVPGGHAMPRPGRCESGARACRPRSCSAWCCRVSSASSPGPGARRGAR